MSEDINPVTVVSPETFDWLTSWLDQPVEPNPALQELARLRPFRFKAHHLLSEVAGEREHQLEKWGVQHHADGTGNSAYRRLANLYKRENDDLVRDGEDPDWAGTLLEEVYEALSEKDSKYLREELIQVAAVCVGWVEDLDARG